MKKKLLLNTVSPILLQITNIICGFVLPRCILETFGSNVNGLVQSITQFLTVISFFEMGVGSVIRYNLYKPLVDKNTDQLSKVMVSANKFFRKLAKILLVYVAILMAIYPGISKQSFSHMYTATLIAAMSISSFSQYYFGQVNQLLLTADQKGYIQYITQIATVLVNTLACIILINCGAGIHTVKIVTSAIYLVRPIFLQWYVRRYYNIDYEIYYTDEPIKQKWNGLAQHISAVVLEGTDIIILTLFSTLKNVSIYSTYYLVVNGLKTLILSATSGIEALIGELIAKNNVTELRNIFSRTEWLIHTIASFVYSCAGVLIVPFVKIYTYGIIDTNYDVPLFGFLLTVAYMVYSLRLPYSILILSAGHYKETQHYYIVAAMMNIIISIAFVYKFGLIGVAIGTLTSLSFQTIWMSSYSYRFILSDNICGFWKQIFVDFLELFLISGLMKGVEINTVTYFGWFCMAIKCVFVSMSVVLCVNLFFYKSRMLEILRKIYSVFERIKSV